MELEDKEAKLTERQLVPELKESVDLEAEPAKPNHVGSGLMIKISKQLTIKAHKKHLSHMEHSVRQMKAEVVSRHRTNNETERNKPVATSFKNFKKMGLFVKKKSEMPDEIVSKDHIKNIEMLNRGTHKRNNEGGSTSRNFSEHAAPNLI